MIYIYVCITTLWEHPVLKAREKDFVAGGVSNQRMSAAIHSKRTSASVLRDLVASYYWRNVQGVATQYILLTSKKWRMQSGCNHSTAYVDQLNS